MTAITIFTANLVIDRAQASGLFDGNTQATANVAHAESALRGQDNMFLVVFMGCSLFVIISSAIVYNHPALFMVSLFVLIIVIAVSAVISNTFWIFEVHSAFTEVSSFYPKIVYIMKNLPLYILFMGVASAIAAFVGYQKQ